MADPGKRPGTADDRPPIPRLVAEHVRLEAEANRLRRLLLVLVALDVAGALAWFALRSQAPFLFD